MVESELWADEIRARAAVVPGTVVKASALASALGLEIYQGKGLKLPGGAALSSWGGRRYIALASGLDAVRARFLVFHEVAEYVLGPSATEPLCNGVAAALAMPRKTFARAVRSEGEEPTRLAEIFQATPTSAALRIGEVTDAPIVALSKSFVWVRGREWVWPPEAELRRIVRRGYAGVRVVQLEPKRAALFVEDVEGGGGGVVDATACGT